jgi:dolichol-phosphate mannosyltransferase
MQEHRAPFADGRSEELICAPVLAVVIPCFRVRQHVLSVIRDVGDEVAQIYCVDDACPDHSGTFILEHCSDPRVRVLFNPTNLGVGGAMITGYRAALESGADVVVKVDGDGQMDPRLIPSFVWPILSGEADYTKGNRFYNLADAKPMPPVRLIGNAILSFLTKISSGYWNVFDPTNGYTAVHAAVLRQMKLEEIAQRYFFESDFLFHLNLIRAVVIDIPMKSVYGNEESNLVISRIFTTFIVKNLRNTMRRLLYSYFLRDFTAASLELIFGLLFVTFGGVFGLTKWIEGVAAGTPATAGTVMIGAFPVITGIQLLLAAVGHDIASVPRTPMHPILSRSEFASRRTPSQTEK